MATRLDRLLVLLDTGSTAVTRKVAAQQLGEVQKLHPHELHNLLHRVHGYLKSSNWDTRIAASQAIEAIVKHVPQWDPVAIKKEDEGDANGSINGTQLSFQSFDIRNVLKHGESLLGSAGDEFEMEEDAPSQIGMNTKEALARERLQLKKKLGLNTPWANDFGIDNLVDDEDLMMPEKRRKLSCERHLSIETLAGVTANSLAGAKQMSSREKNKAIRRAKKLAKQRSKDQQELASNEAPLQDAKPPAPQMTVRTSSVVVDQPGTDSKVVIDSVADHEASLAEAENWPFENFCAFLCQELFDKAWELRHGSASGLREIVKIHGGGAGKVKNTSSSKMKSDNQSWLEDLAVRLLCVFALDRFGDYIADQVVAPVIETCAQTLGTVLHHMEKDGVRSVLSVLVTLLGETEWQVRHGGLLGIKYMLAVRKDMTDELLPQVLPYISQGLQDGDDDVRAVASSALVPVAEELVAVMPSKIPELLSILWETLLDLDDLTASTSSVMALLSSLLYRHNIESQPHFQLESLTLLVPRVWRFLHHNISSVRSAALRTLDTLLSFDVKSDEKKTCSWLPPILRDHLMNVFQRFILEPNEELITIAYKVWTKSIERSPTVYLLAAVQSLAPLWFALIIHPMDAPIDISLLATGCLSKPCEPGKEKGEVLGNSGIFLGSSEPGLSTFAREESSISARLAAARALGPLLMRLYTDCSKDGDALAVVFHGVLQMMSSSCATHRLAGAMILLCWADAGNVSCSETLKSTLHEVLSEQIVYDELVSLHHKMQADIQNLIMVFVEDKRDISLGIQPGCYTVDTAQEIAGSKFNAEYDNLSADGRTVAQSKRNVLISTINQLQKEYQKHHTRVLCVVAATVIALKVLPEKLNPVIRPLMDSIKREENKVIQSQAAQSLSKLLLLCVDRKPCPNNKIIKNLASFLCCDPYVTPKVGDDFCPNQLENSQDLTKDEIQGQKGSRIYGILTLNLKERQTTKTLKRNRLIRASSKNSGAALGLSDDSQQNAKSDADELDDETAKELTLQRRGGELALCQISELTKGELPKKLPSLWDICYRSLRLVEDCSGVAASESLTDEVASALITSLRSLEVTALSLDSSLYDEIKQILPNLVKLLKYPLAAIRHMSARCLGALSKVMTVEVMQIVLEDVFPLLGATDEIVYRQGAIETITNIVDRLKMDSLPYIVLLVVPVLGRMSDQVGDIRTAASSCFATLIQLIPLEAGIPDPPQLSRELIEQKKNERRFLEQLLDGSKLDSYKIPITIKAELRKYQQDGVNWLAFLNKYKLHGILCDDMGLGKTLQSLCVIAGDHHLRSRKFKETRQEDCKPLPSLVICPPTLTGHWCYEVEKFCHKEDLKALHYYGSPGERQRLQGELKKHSLVVASYDIVRNDSEFFLSVHWNYCVLDEGHVIKNSKTKLSYVIKKLKANHRLILSGTPIQNNVLELWALFDFLLPGFLGTEKQFTAKYGKPILQSRDAKSSSKEQEAGVLAMEALHRQVLPFVLRRMKEDVLQDLPPKIIQDFYCDLSHIQLRLYEDFAKSRAKKSLVDSLSHISSNDSGSAVAEKASGQSTHVFQALQYLRKVCNHPALVLKPSHPEYKNVMDELQQMKSSIHDIQHATKLAALKQLLLDCGIGETGSASSGTDPLATDQIVSQHRALIFCQLRSMLDIVEEDLLKTHMPTVTYLRLDGSTPAGNRHNIVQRFNDDPSIDVLLLTTHVGGLGLNLTGADTVIFVEHDWNPTKDLQAMDRAHRIGQKKVVNVYRLITRGTLEEKIMGLQKFKLSIANTVITQDNSSLQSMDTNQLLDLFSVNDDSKSGEKKTARSTDKVSMKALLEDIGELWDQKQYENEYDLDSFMKSF